MGAGGFGTQLTGGQASAMVKAVPAFPVIPVHPMNIVLQPWQLVFAHQFRVVESKFDGLGQTRQCLLALVQSRLRTCKVVLTGWIVRDKFDRVGAVLLRFGVL